MIWKRLALPVLVMAIGVGWLLTNLNILPGVNWVWTGGLGVLGVATLAVCGIDRFTAVMGPFFIISSVASILRQTGRVSMDVEVPGLFIAFGALWMLSAMLPLPSPKWLIDHPTGGAAK